jgi:hypothetical protein
MKTQPHVLVVLYSVEVELDRPLRSEQGGGNMVHGKVSRSAAAFIVAALVISACMIASIPGNGARAAATPGIGAAAAEDDATPGVGAAAAGEAVSGWSDTLGPGNGTALSLLYVSARKELYRGTNRGVWVYDPAEATWSPLGGGLAEYTVYSLAWDGSRLYAGTGDEIWTYDPSSRLWTTMDHRGGYSLAWSGSVLYSGDWEGVWRYDPAAGTWESTGGGLASQFITSLAWTGSRLYAGTREAGVWFYSPGAGSWTDTGGGMSSDSIESLAWDGSHLYAAKNNGSVWRYKQGTGTWADISGAISGYSVSSMAWDGAGLYAGTQGHGIWRYNPGTTTWQNKSGSLGAERFLSLAWDGSRLYAGTQEHGVWRYAPGTATWTDTGGGVSSYMLEDLAWDGTHLYAATVDGVFRYDPSTGGWAEYGSGCGGYPVTCLSWGGAGSFYAGTAGGGVWRYDQGSGNWVDTGGGVSGLLIYDLSLDGSRLYAATYENGVWRYNPGTTTWTDTAGGVSGKTVLSLAWGGSRLYAGTYEDGVWSYDPGGGGWADLAGPGSFRIVSLAWDGTGLYAGSEGNGLWHYDPGGLWAPVAPEISNYTCSSLAWDGSRLFFGSSGVWEYDPASGACVNTGGSIARRNVGSLAAAGSRVYAAPSGWGVWAFDPSERTWYLAEGSTAGGMETWILVQNPGTDPVTVDLTLMTESGIQKPTPLQDQVIPGESRRSFPLHAYVTTYDVSTMVTSEGGDIICERAMYGPGRGWAHDSIGVTSPMPEWYLAEGSTDGGMETYILVQNPGDTPVNVEVTFMTGSSSEIPEELRSVPVAANSRVTFNAGAYVTDYNLSTKVRSFGGGVVCERAMYGNGWAWAHDSIGVNAPRDTWYLAEGSTYGGMETWVLVQNPNEDEVLVDFTLMTGGGEMKPQELQAQPVAGGSRRSFLLNTYVSTYDVSTKVTSEGGNVICERAMYGPGKMWAHDSVGVFAPASTWYLAEGSTAGGMETWILVQNPGEDPVTVDLTLMTDSGVQNPAALQDQEIAGNSRRSFPLHAYVTTYDVSTMVTSEGGNVICERAMYGPGRGWAHDSIGHVP